jgi:hypothetical protein
LQCPYPCIVAAYANFVDAIGQIRFTDLRASQISKLQAESNVISSQLNLLRLRYSIKRLTGELLD